MAFVWFLVKVVVAFTLLMGAFWLGALRFAHQQRSLGRWNTRGPRTPSHDALAGENAIPGGALTRIWDRVWQKGSERPSWTHKPPPNEEL